MFPSVHTIANSYAIFGVLQNGVVRKEYALCFKHQNHLTVKSLIRLDDALTYDDRYSLILYTKEKDCKSNSHTIANNVPEQVMHTLEAPSET